MKVAYSDAFIEDVEKLSGKIKESVSKAIQKVVDASSLRDIPGVKKLVSYHSVYRLRVGTYRAFFTFHVQIIDDVVKFEYLVLRGEAYGKKNLKRLRDIDS